MTSLRWFRRGLIVTCVFATGHLAGFVQATQAARHDPRMADLTQAMRAQKDNVLGFQPSILDFREYFSLNFSILLFLAAGLGFAMLSSRPADASVIRRLSLIYLIAMVALTLTSLWFSVIQGIVSCVVIGILFGLAWRTT